MGRVLDGVAVERSGIDSGVLRRIHASAIDAPTAIRQILERLLSEKRELTGKRTLRGDAETALIQKIGVSDLDVSTSHILREEGESLFLNFAIDGRSYFFSSVTVAVGSKGEPIRITLPSTLYVAERRDRPRHSRSENSEAPQRVRLSRPDSDWFADADVDDYSPVGLNVQAQCDESTAIGDQLRVRYLDGVWAGNERWGQIRYAGADEGRRGWVRLGLAVSEAPLDVRIGVLRRNTITEAGVLERTRQRLAMLSAGAASVSARLVGRLRDPAIRPNVRVVQFENDRGERIRGIIDAASSSRGATAVVIPPAWGRTKETLLPLARTIVETFRRSGEDVTVLRFDGTRRRGESHKERGFEAAGSEHLRFSFSDAISDITASARFLTEDPDIAASQVILVTFSAASIEGRRAVLLDNGERIRGWVSVVGSPDLQSGMRTVSGGIDYVAGADQGVHFGRQEIMGVATDADLFLSDALGLKLAFLEDSRRDMASIRVPVTWIHGANDAWLDLDRVSSVMSCGELSARKLIEVPTGHQLRTSREALEVFQLVACEVGEMALHRAIEGRMPNIATLEALRRAERDRLPKRFTDIKSFWKDYLIGRASPCGIVPMNATRVFIELMSFQIERLDLADGEHVADVGAGTGAFPLSLAERLDRPSTLTIDEIDYVAEGLCRAKRRLDARVHSGMRVNFIECDLDERSDLDRVFPPSNYDAALLSLVLSYMRAPETLLDAVFRSLLPGGRIVVSSLKRDADISRLYIEGVDELRQGRVRDALGPEAEQQLDASVRSFLNDMARVLDLEEQGVFRFLDPAEVKEMMSVAGFRNLSHDFAFGDPPQAVVIAGIKPLRQG